MASDSDLVRELRQGSDHAFAALYERYKLPVFRYCLKMLRDVDAAKDVVQTVFLRMYEHRDDLVFADRFKAWIFAIARNHCFTHLRTRGRTMELKEVVGVTESAVKSRLFKARRRLYDLLKPLLRERG
jgi:RNA polymerase sigma-70 factor (ECF subfamily)